MTENYEIVFQIEKSCERKINKRNPLSDVDIDKIIKAGTSFFENGNDVLVHKLCKKYYLPYNMESTLYVVKLGEKKRALISIDADEIFDKLIITLWGYTTDDDYKKMFQSIRESMYQKFLFSNKGE